MVPTKEQLTAIAIGPTNADNVTSIIMALDRFGAQFGLDLPHRLAHFFAQLGEESGGFRWDKELASGAEYEGRKDLGNVNPGDGARFKGRTGGQITGRVNYRAFTAWVRANVAANAPDFEANPELLNTDPWEGLGPIWYWATRKLNALADEDNIEQITKKWNGGLNGFQARVEYLVRSSLVFLNFGPTDVRGFQLSAQDSGLYIGTIDSDPGPKTRAALHKALAGDVATTHDIKIAAAPVVENVAVATPMVAKGADKPGIARLWTVVPLLGTPVAAFGGLDNVTKGIILGVVLIGVVALWLRGEQIAARTKQLVRDFTS